MQPAPDQEPKTKQDVDDIILKRLEENERNWSTGSDLMRRDTWRIKPRQLFQALGILMLGLIVFLIGDAIDRALHIDSFWRSTKMVVPLSVILIGVIIFVIYILIERRRLRK